MGIEYALQSDPGLVRKNNEDSCLALPEMALFAVADGMGGHNAGEIASALAVETLSKQAEQLSGLMVKPPWWRRLFKRSPDFNPILFLQEAVTAANTAIYEAARASPSHHFSVTGWRQETVHFTRMSAATSWASARGGRTRARWSRSTPRKTSRPLRQTCCGESLNT